MHDASCHIIPCASVSMRIMHASGAGARCKCQKFLHCSFSWSQRTIPDVKTLQYVFYFELLLSSCSFGFYCGLLLLSSCSFGFYCGLTSLLFYSSCELHSILISVLDSANKIHCQIPATLSSPSITSPPPPSCPPLKTHPAVEILRLSLLPFGCLLLKCLPQTQTACSNDGHASYFVHAPCFLTPQC